MLMYNITRMERTVKSKKRHFEQFVVSLFSLLIFAPIFVVGATHLDNPATKLFNNTRIFAEQTIKRIRSDSASLFQGAPLQNPPTQFASVALSGSSDSKDDDFSYSSSISVFINKAIAFTREFFASIFGQQNQTKLTTAPATIVQPVQNVPIIPPAPVPAPVPDTVRERVIERTIVLSAPPVSSSISEGFLAEQLGKIESVLRAEISRVETNATRQSDNNSSTISAVNRMNAISSMYPSNTIVGQTITDSSFSGTTFTGITGSFSGDVSAASLSVTGDATFDINTLFVDSLNNRVGIGTATPSDTLSVNGALYLSQASAPASTTDRLYNTSGSLFWAGNIIGGATTGNWVTDGTNAWRAAGNVGIGTTTPDSKLTVIGDGYFDGNITTSGLTATGTANITGLTTTGNLWVTGSSTLTNFTAGNSTTTNATSTNSFATNLSATNGVFTNATSTNATSTNLFVTNLSATNSSLTNATSTSFFSDVGRLTTGIIDTLTGTTATITELNITNATSTNSFATTASSTNLFTSNFSLGSISGFLKATAGAVTNALINLTTDITGILGVANGGTGASIITGLLQGNGTGAVTGIAGTAGQFPYYNGANTLVATSTLFLSNDGNVGIGTTAPVAKLHVAGDGAIMRLSSNDFIVGQIESRGTGVNYDKGLLRLFDTGTAKIYLDTAGDSYFNGGNVGIGTTAPVHKLDVVGNLRFGLGQGGGNARGYLGGTWTNTEGYNFATLGSTYFNGTNWITNESTSFGSNYVSVMASDTTGIKFYTQNSTGNTTRTDTTTTFNTYERMRIDMAGNVGIGTAGPLRRLSVLDTSANPQFRVSYDATNYAELTINALGDLAISTTGGDIGYYNENLRVCAGGACPADPPGLAGQGNVLAEGAVFADAFNPATCPAGMISVPASPADGKQGFCVDKYEAKSVGGVATSQASGSPWVSIAQYDARAACIVAGKHLITEPEWLAIAHNIENVGWNWNGGVAGTNQMSDGHSDNVPASSLAADITGNADDDPCVGTGQTCSLTTWDSQRRTYKFSNGEYIWDFGGNIWEWTDEVNRDEYPVLNSLTAGWQACATTGDGICGNMKTTNDNWYRGAVTTARGFVRGGGWGGGALSGAFTLDLSDAPANVSAIVGFRCAR